MDSKIIIASVIIIAIAAVFIFLQFSQQSVKPTATSSTQTVIQAQQSSSTTAAPNSTAVLFNSTQYSQYSYLISSPNLSVQAQSALAGFKLSRTVLQNSSVEINISLVNTGQGNKILLKPGYKLYLIETTFGDDGYSFDSSLGDDGFVIVDQNGYLA